MSALAEVQREFQDYLLRGDAAVMRHVVETVRVPASTRLGIYAGAYRSRLAEALASNYPVLATLLGEADFSVLAAEYIATHESPFFSIHLPTAVRIRTDSSGIEPSGLGPMFNR